MTLLEAIQKCGENWFRPVGWQGSGEAIKIICGFTYYEGKQEASRWMCPMVISLTGDWGIVTPEQVRGERG